MISILIPTMNRADFIHRALTYYSQVGFSGYICLGDSSNSDHAARIKASLETFQNRLKIIYRYFPSPPYTNDALCMRELVELAPTPYVVYAGDDDFVIPKTLEQCAAFLDEHPDYGAAHGISVSVQLTQPGAYGPVNWARYMEGHIIESESPVERWMGYMRHALSSQYYLHRKEIWQRMYQDVSKIPSRYWGPEILPCSLSMILGKIKEIDALSCVFQVNYSRNFGWDTHSMYSLMMSLDWSPSVRTLRQIVVQAIVEQDPRLELDQVEQVVDRELWRHILILLQSHYDSRFDEPLNVFAALKKKAPWLVNLVRTGRQVRRNHYRRISLPALLNPGHHFHADFMPVYQTLIGSLSQPDKNILSRQMQ